MQANSSHFDLPELSGPSSQLGEHTSALWVLVPCATALKVSPGPHWSLSSLHLFPLRSHSPWLSDVQCFENYFFNVFFPSIFSCFR